MSSYRGGPITPVVGDELPQLSWTSGFDLWNRFAAVNDEFVPIHMDDEAGRAAGFPSAIGMGYLQWSWIHNLLREFVGPHGRIHRVQGSFRAPSLKNVLVTVGGRVTGVAEEQGRVVVDLEVWVRDEGGAVLLPGTATVSLAAETVTRG